MTHFAVYSRVRNALLSANKKNRAKDLTESEKFALAIFAGVPTSEKTLHNRLQVTTKPCAFTKVNGQWKVYVKSDEEL